MTTDERKRSKPPMKPFELGPVFATPGVLNSVSHGDIFMALIRNSAGDWGQVSPDDWKANNEALTEGGRLLSVYPTGRGEKIWIITEADRSRTTIFLPGEY